jgi:AraC family transcriptional regulator
MLPAGSTLTIGWLQPLHLLTFALEDSFARSQSGVHGFTFPTAWNVADGLLGDLLSRLACVGHSLPSSEKMYADSLAIAIVEQVAGNYPGTRNDTPKGRLSPQQLLQVISYAHDHMHQDIGLIEMANLVHLSPYHFGRLFKQTIGVSPYQYLIQLRIEFAKKLIIDHPGLLGDIAYQLNFSDQAHFSNAFRKATGLSPRKYRQSHLQPT